MKDSNRSASPIALAAFALMIVAALGLRAKQAYDDHRVKRSDLTVGDRTFVVEIADTDKKRERGLGKRDGLEADQGMIFPFETADRWVFWMKDMRFPIDIVWIREMKVVDIHRNVPAPTSEKLETYSPIEPADLVLELRSGMAAEAGIEAGDTVEIRPHK